MPLIDEIELKKQIKNRMFKRVYLIFGEDNYLKLHYAKKIAESAIDDVLVELNLAKLEGKTLTMQTLADETDQLPVMAEKRCVLISDYDTVSKGETEIADFKQIISELPESTVLILLMDTIEINIKKPGKWSSILKLVDNVGATVNFEHKNEATLVKMLVDSASKRKVKMDIQVARYMVSVCGRDLQTLHCELDKLCAYKINGTILKEDIDLVSSRTEDVNKYHLQDAIFSGNVSVSLKLIDDLLYQIQYTEILGIIIGSFVDVYRVKAAIAAGKQATDIAKDFGYAKNREFVLKKAVPTANKMSFNNLRKCLDILDDADTKLKSTSLDKKFVLEQTVIMLIETMRNND